MKFLSFIWDDKKNHLNIHKHNVSFEEAKTVFLDDLAIEFFDENHSDFEERFIMLGMSHKARLIIVSYCLQNYHSVIRIISARKATKNESKHYPGGLL